MTDKLELKIDSAIIEDWINNDICEQTRKELKNYSISKLRTILRKL